MARTHEVPNHLNVEDTLFLGLTARQVATPEQKNYLRQAIEKQMDRIEHAHRFTRAVSVGNPREFLQAEKEDQEMAEACLVNSLTGIDRALTAECA